MIRDLNGERVTPKQKAQSLIMDKLGELSEGYWIEHEQASLDGDQGITDREIAQVREQLAKLSNRIAKMLGYIPHF